MRIEIQTDLKKGNCPQAIQEKPFKTHSLVQRLVLAYQIQALFEHGQAKNLAQVADWLGYTAPRICQIYNLLLLAPSIQREILVTELKDRPALNERQIRLIPLEPLWEKQEAMWRQIVGPAEGNPA